LTDVLGNSGARTKIRWYPKAAILAQTINVYENRLRGKKKRRKGKRKRKRGKKGERKKRENKTVGKAHK